MSMHGAAPEEALRKSRSFSVSFSHSGSFRSIGVSGAPHHWCLRDVSPGAGPPRGDAVAASARLSIRRGGVSLSLAYHPTSSASIQHPVVAPPNRERSSEAAVTPPLGGSINSSDGGGSHLLYTSTGSGSAPKVRRAPPRTLPRRALAAPHSRASTLHRSGTQRYRVTLRELSPLAAQLPLSNHLRTRLQLHRKEAEESNTTYTSHFSTPRPSVLRPGGSALHPLSLMSFSNFCLPPSRGFGGFAERRRDDGIAQHVTHHGCTAGRPHESGFLDGANPSCVLAHSSPVVGSVAEVDDTLMHAPVQEKSCSGTCSSLPPSKGSSNTGGQQPLLVPLQKPPPRIAAFSLGYPTSSRSSPALTPQRHASNSAFVPPACAAALNDYADLRVVAFFGVTESAGVRNCSFSADDEGHLFVEKKVRRRPHHTLPQRLPSWFLPASVKRPQSRRIGGADSTSTVDESEEVSSTTTLPSWSKSGSASPTTSGDTCHRVLASEAHIDFHQMLSLPLVPHEAQTFFLRFRSEKDMRDFLCSYLELKTHLDRAPKQRRHREMGFSTDMHPEDVAPSRESSPVSDRTALSSRENENGVLFSNTSQSEYPRNPEAVGPALGTPTTIRPSEKAHPSLEVFDDTETRGEQVGHGSGGDFPPAAGGAAAYRVPTAFFSGRGWEDFLAYRVDPRYGVPFASIPLFLWHSFLPLASMVLYTCYRGYLEVVAGAAEVGWARGWSPCGHHHPALEISDHLLRQLSTRSLPHLLTPIDATKEVVVFLSDTASAHHRLPASGCSTPRNRHGLTEVIPAPIALPEYIPELAYAPFTSIHCSKDVLKTSQAYPTVVNEEGPARGAASGMTSITDVFLCLTERHMLFLDSFGRLHFQCCFDEVKLITYATCNAPTAATSSFPTFPFIRFRLHAGEAVGAPIFDLVFTFLPDVPTSVPEPAPLSRDATPGRMPRGSRSSTPGDELSGLALSKNPSASASWVSLSSAMDTNLMTGHVSRTLKEEDKAALLSRQRDFLRVFETVCPRPLQHCTFTEMMNDDSGRPHRAQFRRLFSRSDAAAANTATVGRRFSRHVGSASASSSAVSWMEQLHGGEDPILCVGFEEGDIQASWREIRGQKDAQLHSPVGSYAATASWLSVDRSRAPRSSAHQMSDTSTSDPQASVVDAIPRWGLEDPVMVLQDVNTNMDFSLEKATRMMPLLVKKEAVCQPSQGRGRRSLPLVQDPHTVEAVTNLEAASSLPVRRVAPHSTEEPEQDVYAPIAPRKRKSRAVSLSVLRKSY